MFQGVFLPNQEKVAIKVFIPGRKKKVRREVAMLQYLSEGPNIENVREVVRNPLNNQFCMVSDFYLYDNFTDYFQKFTLKTLQNYMRELLRALDFIHSKGVVHRDIKPQNVLYSFKSQKMKIIDFGLAEFYHPDKQLSPRVASKYFKAPELLLDYPYYHYSVDVWAAGIIFASIVCSSAVQALPAVPRQRPGRPTPEDPRVRGNRGDDEVPVHLRARA